MLHWSQVDRQYVGKAAHTGVNQQAAGGIVAGSLVEPSSALTWAQALREPELRLPKRPLHRLILCIGPKELCGKCLSTAIIDAGLRKDNVGRAGDEVPYLRTRQLRREQHKDTNSRWEAIY